MTVRSAIDLDLNQRPEILVAIEESSSRCLVQSDLEKAVPGVGPKQEGKVRDVYSAKPAAGSAASGDSSNNPDEEVLVVVTTDRQSAFDRILASIPFKGQVLNQTSAWWFEQTAPIVPNAFLSSPDPNVTLFRKCKVFPVEFVVRGYITGTTSTSLWTVYSDGARSYCGNDLPEGLRKNDRLAANILTPTTKAADHDEPVTPEEIVSRGLMTREEFETTRDLALKLFAFGQQVAGEHGLILVDTKYEFGKDSNGNIRLIDEVHTPDSSRYWIASTYEQRHAEGLEPQNIDKEFLRLWFRKNCDPYNDKTLPAPPAHLITELSWRYIALYEAITGRRFHLPDVKEDISERIKRNVAGALQSL
ncbi:unnamed protein product [Closterium sp. NIES-53]